MMKAERVNRTCCAVVQCVHQLGLRTKQENQFMGSHIIIILYIYHVLINVLSTNMLHINLSTIFYMHVEHSSTETIYVSII